MGARCAYCGGAMLHPSKETCSDICRSSLAQRRAGDRARRTFIGADIAPDAVVADGYDRLAREIDILDETSPPAPPPTPLLGWPAVALWLLAIAALLATVVLFA